MLYRCHFLDARDHIRAHEEIEAGSLLDLVQLANAMLDRRSHHDAVEIWAGNRGSTAPGGTVQSNAAAHARSRGWPLTANPTNWSRRGSGDSRGHDQLRVLQPHPRPVGDLALAAQAVDPLPT